tara:strand:+ start:29 stop:529 length:501 start_codon:yes stop_codon:yes gene_type:complete
MNPIEQIQNYREKYSVMNVPRNLKTDIKIFNMKRKITDKELDTVKNVIGFESANFTGIKNNYLKFNLKRKITDEELSSILDKRIEVLKAEIEMWKEKTAMAKKEIELIKIEERIAKYELEHPEWKEEADRKEAEEEEKCTDEKCWCNTLKGKELEEAFEAYERSEV